MPALTVLNDPDVVPSGKAARRRRILEAARALISERGEAGFSMTALAARAGFSPATPYNLVGPRTKVLEALVTEEFAGFRGKLEALVAPRGLARVLAAAELVTDHYGAEPDFYRGLYHAMVTAGGEELRRMMGLMGQDLWGVMIADAADDLEPVVAVEPFTDHLLQVISSATQGWLVEGWSDARYRAEMRYGVLMCLSGAVRAAGRRTVLDQLSAVQSELVGLRAPAGSPPPR